MRALVDAPAGGPVREYEPRILLERTLTGDVRPVYVPWAGANGFQVNDPGDEDRIPSQMVRGPLVAHRGASLAAVAVGPSARAPLIVSPRCGPGPGAGSSKPILGEASAVSNQDEWLVLRSRILMVRDSS